MIDRRLIITGVLLLGASHPVHADKVFAHSKSLDMSFTALGDPWCGTDVSMQVNAGDAGKFDTPDYATIIQKLGHVLMQECPEAESLAITGLADEATVWTGTATRAAGWVAQKSAPEAPAAAQADDSAGAAATTLAGAEQAAPQEAAAEQPAAEETVEETAQAAAAAVEQTATETADTATAAVEAAAAETPAVAETAAETSAAQIAKAAPVTVAEPDKPAAAAPPAATPTTGADATEAVTEAPPAAVEAPAPALEIAGWKPGGKLSVTGSAAESLKEITAQDSDCRIRTFTEVKDQFKPSFKMNREVDCTGGYASSAQRKRADLANLYYEGQQQQFKSLQGFWNDGFNLQSGFPRQIVSIYDAQQPQQARYGYRQPATVKMLVWAGEDPELRAHFFATYTLSYEQWRPDALPNLIVLTDNDELKTNPDKTRLAESLSEVYKDFLGHTNTNRFNAVSFAIVDRMLDMPGMKYQLAVREANPDAAFYKAGRAVRYRGTPWTIEVQTDFVAKREAFKLAEQQRLEAEKQRLAQLRQRHQASLDQQYQQLVSAANYDKVRFYATLMLDRERMNNSRIDFTSNRAYYGNALGGAVVLSHPAQYINHVVDGTARLGAPMYMLVKADDGEIEKPYPITVTRSDAEAELDDWMLVRTGPEFDFRFDDDGRPVFEITVQDAIACKTEKCLGEMDAATMMKTWYDDDQIEFAAVEVK